MHFYVVRRIETRDNMGKAWKEKILQWKEMGLASSQSLKPW